MAPTRSERTVTVKTGSDGAACSPRPVHNELHTRTHYTNITLLLSWPPPGNGANVHSVVPGRVLCTHGAEAWEAGPLALFLHVFLGISLPLSNFLSPTPSLQWVWYGNVFVITWYPTWHITRYPFPPPDWLMGGHVTSHVIQGDSHRALTFTKCSISVCAILSLPLTFLCFSPSYLLPVLPPFFASSFSLPYSLYLAGRRVSLKRIEGDSSSSRLERNFLCTMYFVDT